MKHDPGIPAAVLLLKRAFGSIPALHGSAENPSLFAETRGRRHWIQQAGVIIP